MANKKAKKYQIVSKYAKMWPRDVFHVRIEKNKCSREVKKLLSQPGVYVLYRDDRPYYVGKASKGLYGRLRTHAENPKDKYYNFWNFFSAFAVKNKRRIPEVEGILIAAMPTDNSIVPRIQKIYIPSEVANALKNQRMIKANN